jgi:AraC-like DNA-binding protein
MAVESLILELCVEATRPALPDMQGGPPIWLRTAHDFLKTTFRSSLTLAEIAQTAGVHQVTLAKGFRRHYGCTVSDYIRTLRIDDACKLLRSSDQTVAQIAQDAGFFDESHFSRVFRRRMGISPGKYRLASRAAK